MKRLFFILGLTLITVTGYCAWNAAKPSDTEKLKDTPALIRANWDAIATGTDASLLVTNAKVSPTAAIVDTKLATISTAGKVSGTALTSLTSIPSGAGALPVANGGTGSATQNFVDLTTGQTVAGLKTFSTIPALPESDPTTDNQAVRKAYVDGKKLNSFADPDGAVDFNNQQATGFLIENRTNDTGCTQTGRIWLRTD